MILDTVYWLQSYWCNGSPYGNQQEDFAPRWSFKEIVDDDSGTTPIGTTVNESADRRDSTPEMSASELVLPTRGLLSTAHGIGRTQLGVSICELSSEPTACDPCTRVQCTGYLTGTPSRSSIPTGEECTNMSKEREPGSQKSDG